MAGVLADAQPIEYAGLDKAMGEGLLVLLLLVSASPQMVSATGRVSSSEVGSPGITPAAPLACDPDGAQASGAVYRICMPSIIP